MNGWWLICLLLIFLAFMLGIMLGIKIGYAEAVDELSGKNEEEQE